MFGAGDLDTSFSGDGRATITFPGGLAFNAADVAVLPDGKAIVVGNRGGRLAVTPAWQRQRRYHVRCIRPGRIAAHDQPRARSRFRTTERSSSEGKAARFDDGSGNSVFKLARLLESGAFDSSFGTNGIIKREPGDSGSEAVDIAVQRDGRIVAVADAFVGLAGGTFADYDFVIYRFNENGSTDDAFGDGGATVLDFGAQDHPEAVAIDYNGAETTNSLWGSIVVVGERREDHDSEEARFAVARLTRHGDPDNGFDGNGMLTSTFDATYSHAMSVLIQPFGRIVAAGLRGSGRTSSNQNFVVIRYLSNGSIDTAGFAASGLGYVETNLGGNDRAYKLMPSYLNGLLVAGTSDGHFAAAAYSFDGLLENGFDGDGIADLGRRLDRRRRFGRRADAKVRARRRRRAGGAGSTSARSSGSPVLTRSLRNRESIRPPSSSVAPAVEPARTRVPEHHRHRPPSREPRFAVRRLQRIGQPQRAKHLQLRRCDQPRRPVR